MSLALLVASCDSTSSGGPSGKPDAGNRTCTYKGQVYADQQVWTDGCNQCKCNPEGTTGVGCSLGLCPDLDLSVADGRSDGAPADGTSGDGLAADTLGHQDSGTDGGPPCRCTSPDICIVPCCGGAPPQCHPKPDSGMCPPGTHAGCMTTGQDGCEDDPCTPPPPYCSTTVPVGCTVNNNGVAECICA